MSEWISESMTVDKAITKIQYGLEMETTEMTPFGQLTAVNTEALKTALAALRAQQQAEKNDPLTLEELRELPIIESWVWIEILKPDAIVYKATVSAYYRKHAGISPEQFFECGYPGLGFAFDYKDYGKTWLAYRHKPEEG